MLNPNYTIFEDKINDVFQIRNKTDVFTVEFNNEIEKGIFLKIIDFFHKKKDGKLEDIIEIITNEFDKGKAYKVMNDMIDYGLLLKENIIEGFNTELTSQINFWVSRNDTSEIDNKTQLKIKNFRVLILGNGYLFSQIVDRVLRSGFESVEKFETNDFTSKEQLKDVIYKSDIIVFETQIWNPNIVELVNKICLELNKPWIIVRGVNNLRISIGPLFLPNETGCYQCLDNRLKSNMDFLPYYKEYEKYLKENKLSGNSESAPLLIFDIASSICVLELIKFVTNWDIPAIFNSYITMDISTYEFKNHSFLKVPSCPVCRPELDYNIAPWLEPLILNNK